MILAASSSDFDALGSLITRNLCLNDQTSQPSVERSFQDKARHQSMFADGFTVALGLGKLSGTLSLAEQLNTATDAVR